MISSAGHGQLPPSTYRDKVGTARNDSVVTASCLEDRNEVLVLELHIQGCVGRAQMIERRLLKQNTAPRKAFGDIASHGDNLACEQADTILTL